MIINMIIYWSVYILKSFIQWDLQNPFQWILDLPYNEDLRTLVLVALFFDIIAIRFMVVEISFQHYLNKPKS